MVRTPLSDGSIALLLALVVALAALPGVAAADTRSGGTVVVEAGETVGGLTAYAGTVVVRGQIDGDLDAYAGNVFVEGEVTGDVTAYAGNVRVAGEVGGDVEASGGNVVVERGATVGGSLQVAAGNVVVAGTVRGDARLAGGSVTLAETGAVDGNVEYDVGPEGGFENLGAEVGGSITRNPGMEVGGPAAFPRIPSGIFVVYGLLANLALGAVLLLAFPGFSRGVADRVAERPLRTVAWGLAALVGIPIGLVVVAITIVGIPLAIAGAIAFGLLAWAGSVYGRFALGAWLLSLADFDNRWGALVVGLLAVALLKRVPVAGGLVEFVVAVLGIGAVALGLAAVYRGRRAAG